jgi:dTDP-glucose 4,6-dehydratase
MKNNYLITGGCGFIGANFIHFLLHREKDCRVVNLDNLTYAGNQLNLRAVENDPRYRFVKGDICDFNLVFHLLNEEKITAIVHFAAESHVDRSIHGPADFIQTNIVGTFTLLEAAKKTWLAKNGGQPDAVRFLHISTDEVYGSLGPSGLFTESTPYDPRSPYSASKASSDHLVSSYFHTYGLPTLISNCSNNYGPYQFPEKLIPLAINNAIKGAKIPVYGDGRQIRDWLHVIDHCEAILVILRGGTPGETFNVGGNNEKYNIDVLRTVCDILDRKLGLPAARQTRQELLTFVTDRPGHDRRYGIDATKLRETLGWTPKTTFEVGIEKTVDWYLANQDWTNAVLDGSYQTYYDTMYKKRLS